MEFYRKAALYLHGLNTDDCQWLMEHLSAERVKLLKPMLNELSELNIPKEPGFLGEYSEALSSIVEPSAELSSLGILWRSDPDEVAAAFDDESDALFGLFLSLESWPWCDEVLEQVGERKEAISHSIDYAKVDSVSEKAKDALYLSVIEKINSFYHENKNS